MEGVNAGRLANGEGSGQLENAMFLFEIIKKALPYLDDSLPVSMARLISNIVIGFIPLPFALRAKAHAILRKLKGQSRFRKKVRQQKSFFSMFTTFLENAEESSGDETPFEIKSPREEGQKVQ